MVYRRGHGGFNLFPILVLKWEGWGKTKMADRTSREASLSPRKFGFTYKRNGMVRYYGEQIDCLQEVPLWNLILIWYRRQCVSGRHVSMRGSTVESNFNTCRRQHTPGTSAEAVHKGRWLGKEWSALLPPLHLHPGRLAGLSAESVGWWLSHNVPIPSQSPLGLPALLCRVSILRECSHQVCVLSGELVFQACWEIWHIRFVSSVGICSCICLCVIYYCRDNILTLAHGLYVYDLTLLGSSCGQTEN